MAGLGPLIAIQIRRKLPSKMAIAVSRIKPALSFECAGTRNGALAGSLAVPRSGDLERLRCKNFDGIPIRFWAQG
jgi:hypothetical protein